MILLKSLHSEGLLSHDEGRWPLGFLEALLWLREAVDRMLIFWSNDNGRFEKISYFCICRRFLRGM